jgi:sRNA-binding regulator protein Hfq
MSDIKRQADELAAQGMPFQLAMQVAQGKVPLNDALERLNQRVEVDRLMKEHELSRALATQVVLGHADLGAFLAKRRFEEHRTANLDRSCLDRAAQSGQPLTLALFGQRKVEARVLSTSTYHVIVQEEGKEPEQLHKLDLKYAYLPDDWKKLKKIVRKDKELTEHPLRPAERPQDRYTCSDRRLFRYLDEDVAVDVTLLEGEILHGHVQWFGRFEFGLGLKGEGDVTIFRHALHRIQDGK